MKKFALAFVLLVGSLTGVSHAADLVIESDPVVVADPGYDWTGFYVGVFGGYGSGNVLSNSPALPLNVGVAGFLAGVDVGYNWQMDQFVLGIEADGAWSNITGSVAGGACGLGFTCGEQISWLADIKGRVGFAADKALFYATAGLAALQDTSTTQPAGNGITGTFTGTYFGYLVGVGVEVAATENLSIKAEYNYSSYNTLTAPAGTLAIAAVPVNPNALHTVKLGVNWQF